MKGNAEMLPNENQVLSALRWMLTGVGAYLVGRGKLSPTDADTVTGAIINIVSFSLSMIHHSTPTPPKA